MTDRDYSGLVSSGQAHSDFQFISHSAEQTRQVGKQLGALLQPGDVICLIGDLGAGKTTLVQGISAGWGSLDAASSPTFVLVNVYRRATGQRLYHLDAYRLGSEHSQAAAEAEDLDLDTLLDDGPLLVEWADRIQSVLPPERLSIQLEWVDEQQREVQITSYGPHYQFLLAKFRQRGISPQIHGVA